MRAAFYERTGPAQEVLQLGEMPVAGPAPGEVRVRVHASGVNPSDVKKRAGKMPAPAEYPRIVPHSDGAGIIDAVGADVPESRIGERVWLWNAQWRRPFGTAAEHVSLPAAQAVCLPEGVSFAQGACLGIPAQTACVAVASGEVGAGDTVLVQGGAGAVGEMAVAIAALRGARVIATVSGPEKAEIARSAGATETIDYRSGDVVDALRELTQGHGVDHIVEVDFGANWRMDAAVLRENGSIAAYSAPSAPCFELDYYAFAAKAARLRFVQVYLLNAQERARTIAEIDTLLAAGKLPQRIARRFALDKIAAAHLLQESGTAIGNIVLDIIEGEKDAHA